MEKGDKWFYPVGCRGRYFDWLMNYPEQDPHGGVEQKTLTRGKQQFFWPNRRKEVDKGYPSHPQVLFPPAKPPPAEP